MQNLQHDQRPTVPDFLTKCLVTLVAFMAVAFLMLLFVLVGGDQSDMLDAGQEPGGHGRPGPSGIRGSPELQVPKISLEHVSTERPTTVSAQPR